MKTFSTGEPQRSLAREAVYKGIGLHTGNKCQLIFKPAPANHGVVFVRTDLPGSPRLPANHNIVSSVIRGTTLSLDGEKGHEARVHTVEHVLSALSGLGIDNLEIEVNANEPPVADGSAFPFWEVLSKAGVIEFPEPRVFFQPDPLVYSAGETRYEVLPADELILETSIFFKHPLVGEQKNELILTRENFLKEIARARTFCFDFEVESLRRQGLARGGSLDNAVVVGMDRVHNKEKVLRYPDEFVRHKTLDLIGDLFLLGMPLKARIKAFRVGHGHNVNLVKQLAAQMTGEKVSPSSPVVSSY
ncbi:MAG: UDP-3-O-[3-hydroxymyristoyl] N-acetylglucosamine deacetylase [Elusimicrobia bacterium]|jgi:UDP-3-O-acyl N-acetylglucosamine deacetylase|nr:UDP-3-O-[3-hydroxymyristoyl] N-acetylglucosamine deacetylase [Elusimicrobiota bacterium]